MLPRRFLEIIALEQERLRPAPRLWVNATTTNSELRLAAFYDGLCSKVIIADTTDENDRAIVTTDWSASVVRTEATITCAGVFPKDLDILDAPGSASVLQGDLPDSTDESTGVCSVDQYAGDEISHSRYEAVAPVVFTYHPESGAHIGSLAVIGN